MRVPRIALFFALIFQPSHQLSAQQSSAVVQRDSQAAAILTQVIQAAGGSMAIGSVQDFTASGSITYFENGEEVSGSVTVRGKGLSEFRLDALLPSGQRSLAVSDSNGTVSGSTKEINGASTAILYHNAVDFGSLTFPLVHIQAALNDAGTNIRYLGLVTLDGRAVHQISVEPFATEGDPGNLVSKLNSKQFFIDSTTLRIARVLNVMHPNSDSTVDYSHEVEFSDYRMINGLLVPFAMTEKVGGVGSWTIKLSQITFNSALTDAEFTL